jgi:hypothetical protein
MLSSVSAAAPDDIWAVGAFGAYDNRQVLIEHWDGIQWRIINPVPGTLAGALLSVEVLSNRSAWAVGYSGSEFFRTTLIMRWDGISWTEAPSPSPGILDNTLYDVAAVTGQDIWAVGSYRNDYSLDETLILHWDGGRWTTVPSPNDPYAANFLYALEVVSARDMWAVGMSGYYQLSSQPMVARYAGRINFVDVDQSDYFYEPVRYLYCANAISGYADGTFRPYNNTTRAQLSKIVVSAQGWSLSDPADNTFNDVLQARPSSGMLKRPSSMVSLAATLAGR